MNQKQLEKKIIEAQEAYYNDEPIMSDMEFDKLWDELKENYPNSKILKSIGKDGSSNFPKAKHTIVMGSQNKATNKEEMKKFFVKYGKDVIWQYKCDGISLELNYKNGKLISGISRGDGKIGDLITDNVLRMNGVVKHLKDKTFTGAVRGEILLYRKAKDKYFPDAKNCRNQASGLSKRLDGKGCEHLTVVVYDAQYLNGKSFGTQEKLQTWLSNQGFIVAEWKHISKATSKEAIELINKIFEQFDKLEYDIDGLVWKQNKIDMNDLSEYRPNTQIALKPARIEKVTKLKNIIWQAKSGTFTPVAILEPVELNGTTVKQANLCNVNNILELGIEIGDKVIISKAGMIIPQITGKYKG